MPALAAYTAALVLWHLPVAYELALRVHPWHVVQHLSLMTAATVAWWPVLSPSTLAPRLHYGAQILYVFAFGMPMTVVAAMITGAEELLYPSYASAPRLFGLTPLRRSAAGRGDHVGPRGAGPPPGLHGHLLPVGGQRGR